VSSLFLASLPAAVVIGHDDPGPGFSTSGEGGFFIRGDADQNGQIQITDAIFTLGYLFLGDRDPFCLDALDTNDDGDVVISDALGILQYLFSGNYTPAEPLTAAGTDPTPGDPLNCDNGRFAYIRREILPSCATSNCHSVQTAAGSLVLEGMLAYGNLYQTRAVNPAAAGGYRVKPADPDNSYLWKKLQPNLNPPEGGHLAEVGVSLDADQMELIRHWIADGSVPSIPEDIELAVPSSGAQVHIPPFEVQVGQEVQRNYFFKLTNDEDMWVDHIEFLYPPGSHHLNFFTGDDGVEHPDGSFEDNFKVVPFGTWELRASSQSGRLDWHLPPGVAVHFKPHAQVLAQIHFVNIGIQSSPIGGCAVVNLHAVTPTPETKPMGSMFLQNKNILICPNTPEISFDYGVTFDFYGVTDPVKLAALTGHFHWRGKSFEIRLWDGLNKNTYGAPADGEFDRMGPENTIFFSDNWNEPPFNLLDDGPDVPPGWGIVYRTTYVNLSENKYCFGPHVETQEHANAFIYFYPGPENADFFWFPPDSCGQGCTVPCTTPCP
jgi:hypothetical protein